MKACKYGSGYQKHLTFKSKHVHYCNSCVSSAFQPASAQLYRCGKKNSTAFASIQKNEIIISNSVANKVFNHSF